MGKRADLTLGQLTLASVYLSPAVVSDTRDRSYYVLEYFDTKGGTKIPVAPEMSTIEFKGGASESMDQARGRCKAGVVFDRNLPPRQQAYADIEAKVAAGEMFWLSNLRDDQEDLG